MDMKKTTEYINLLEDILSLTQEKQEYQEKLISEPDGHEREEYLERIAEIDSVLTKHKHQLKELKAK